MEQLIVQLSPQISEVERDIAAAVQQDRAWAAAARRLQSGTGMGLLSAATILTAMVKFTRCPTAEAATAYAG